MVSIELAMLSQLALWLISADSLTQPVNIQDFTQRELQLLHNLINREVTRSRILKYRIGQCPNIFPKFLDTTGIMERSGFATCISSIPKPTSYSHKKVDIGAGQPVF